MSETRNFMLLALISHMAPYLIFIVMLKFTFPVNMALLSQDAQFRQNFALSRSTGLAESVRKLRPCPDL